MINNLRRLFVDPEERRALLLIFAMFVPMACLGTLAHEGGHIAVARILGYDTTLYYGAMSWDPESKDVEELESKLWSDNLFISLGGPLQTMLTGTVGLLWLWILRRSAAIDEPLGRAGVAATLLALFWSRQVFNSLNMLIFGPGGGDESTVSSLLGYWPGTISLLTGAIGSAACGMVVWLQPRHRRWHLLIAGPAGSFAGLALWYGWLGPILLPH